MNEQNKTSVRRRSERKEQISDTDLDRLESESEEQRNVNAKVFRYSSDNIRESYVQIQ